MSEQLATDVGVELHQFIAELFPLLRSITGEGLRETLRRVGTRIDLRLHEVPSGTKVFDWEVPREWTLRAASIETLAGERIVDVADHTLHILQYSHPIDAVVPLAELLAHVHTLPEAPDLIPYRTSYYVETWGFCLTAHQARRLTDAAYRVRIDSTLAPGSLTYGECLLPGSTEDEVLVSVHACHPSLANDNLSGVAIATELARRLALRPRRPGYRFLFLPGTIGSITWLARNKEQVHRVKHGLVLSCLGDAGPMTYKASRRGDALIDRYAAHVLTQRGGSGRLLPFTPYGYDERQYCSPGFDLPVGCLMRSPNGTFPEYHTSADDLGFVRPESLADSLDHLQRIVDIIENDRTYFGTNPCCEPQLGRRGLYRAMDEERRRPQGAGARFDQMTLLWVLNLADGRHSLFDMAARSGEPFDRIKAAADVLLAAKLLASTSDGRPHLTVAPPPDPGARRSC